MKKIEVGRFGDNVAANVRRHRTAANLTYAELSRRLSALDRPIAELGLRHIETARRRVDVDDLVALAAALDVPPITLLLPDPRLPDQYTQNTFLMLVGGLRGVAGAMEMLKRSSGKEPTDGDD